MEGTLVGGLFVIADFCRAVRRISGISPSAARRLDSDELHSLLATIRLDSPLSDASSRKRTA